MKTKYFFLIIAFGMFFAACKNEKSLKEYMTDSWQTTYLKIEMLTADKSDSTSVYEDKFENNSKRLAQSKYNKDGTFSAWYMNDKNERSEESTGTWSVKNDSLFIEYFYNERNVKVAYKVTKTAEGFDAKAVYDWDEDGEVDDTLSMKTKRIKTTE